MKKRINFLLLSLIVVFLSSCKDENTDNKNEHYNSLILGQWHFSSGSIRGLIGEDDADIYDQILSFNSVGNYSEENAFSNKNEKYNGNWSIRENKITINDWSGKQLDTPVSIIELSENRLEISYLNSKTVYLRVGTEFENLSSKILGYWYEFSDRIGKPFYEFKNNGIVRHRTYQYIDNSPIAQEGQYEWNVEGDKLSLTTLPVRNKTDVYTVKYCNDKYLRLESKDRKIDLKRKK